MSFNDLMKEYQSAALTNFDGGAMPVRCLVIPKSQKKKYQSVALTNFTGGVELGDFKITKEIKIQ